MPDRLAFLVALQFLTRWPVRLPEAPPAEAQGRSLLHYPLVGLLIGVPLAGLGAALEQAPGLGAALVLLCWVVITGGLHLDGLADSADAWAGGAGDRERSLAIMKDPASGPVGVVAVVLVLLLKYAALQVLIAAGAWAPLLVAPLLGRAAVLALFATTPYVRREGLGRPLADHLPRRAAVAVLALVPVPVALSGGAGAVMLLTAGVLGLGLRGLMCERLGGATGDTAGALIEAVEAAALLAAALWFMG